jgi:hypothetical protein
MLRQLSMTPCIRSKLFKLSHYQFYVNLVSQFGNVYIPRQARAMPRSRRLHEENVR